MCLVVKEWVKLIYLLFVYIYFVCKIKILYMYEMK